ncbi:MAG TPA: hypothetical protein VHV49_14255 [Pseudonocardiaceae bacterium]|jgi:hypothetical protein|nr:hypothetical protein [Pseudonocardiaceae bacterium]
MTSIDCDVTVSVLAVDADKYFRVYVLAPGLIGIIPTIEYLFAVADVVCRKNSPVVLAVVVVAPLISTAPRPMWPAVSSARSAAMKMSASVPALVMVTAHDVVGAMNVVPDAANVIVPPAPWNCR